MKREEGKGRQKARSGREENLKFVAEQLLKTMLLLDRPYGPDYLIRIVRGESKYRYWKSPDHLQLETFGMLPKRSWDYLRMSIQHLVLEQLMQPRIPGYAVLEITEKGEDWLERPTDLPVQKSSLVSSAEELYLRRILAEYRRDRAEADGLKQFNVFTNFTLDRIVIEQPASLPALADVAGMNPFRAELFGDRILELIADYRTRFVDHQRDQLHERVARKRTQFIKRQILDNHSAADIAKVMGLTVRTILKYASDLIEVGEVDLRPWIEHQVDAKTLHKGADFFKRVKNPSMKVAFDTLGIDYDVLRLCHLYVSKFTQKQSQLVLQA